MSKMIVLALLVAALLAGAAVGVADAAPACPGGEPPNGRGQCVGRPDAGTVCAWPARLVKAGKVLVCLRCLAGPGM